MQRYRHIDNAIGHFPRFPLILVALCLATLVAGGCSSSVAPSPQPPHDAAPTADSAEIDSAAQPAEETANAEVTTTSTDSAGQRLPRLLDLGATKCIPCKMMAPILDELEREYAGVFDVEFIDVWEHSEEAQKYGIETIPTQIFFDAEGKEVFRHVGFFSKEEILATWNQFGVELKEAKEPDDV